MAQCSAFIWVPVESSPVKVTAFALISLGTADAWH